VAPSDEVDTAMTQVKLFGQLLKMLQFYLRFEIDESSGAALNDTEVMSQHYAFMQKLQRIAFRYFKDDCPDLCLKSIASLDSRQALQQLLTTLSHDQLVVLMQQLGLTVSDEHQSDEFLIEVLINSTERRQSQKQAVNETPLFPDEKVLFDRNLVPEENSGDLVLALPKLNLQFLTLHDYMLRNFQLYRLESTYQIREDLVKACERIQPKLNRHNKTVFTGWSRMAVPIDRVAVTQVRKPRLGDKMPALVQAEVVVDLGAFSGAVREEWESIRKHDTLFVLTMAGNEYYTPPSDLLDDGAEEMDEDRQALEAKIAYEDALKMRAAYGGRGREWRDFTFGRGRTTRRGRATSSYGRGVDQNSRDAASLSNDGVSGATAASLGIQHLRGGEVLEILDENLCVVGQMNEDGNMHKAMGDIRTFRIALDTAQYQLDQEYLLANENASDLYSTFNLLVRRSAKENNFKAVLSTIRDLMNTEFSVPDWLHDSLLGYGDPHASKYYNLPSRLPTVDFADTFLDLEHVKSSFPCHRIEVGQAALPPFRLSFPDDAGAPDYEKLASAALAQAAGQTSSTASAADLPRVLVESYTPAMPRHGAFPRLNHVRYTPTQVEAIRSGSQPGLTMVVGPPGTGKTDVAVQIIVNLYRQFPEQRTILIAHSNQALNDLFEKLMQRDIDERHLLRLGHGEKDIAGDKDFTKFGRVNYMLQRRLECLQHIAALAKSLGMSEDSASTCETAGHFRLYAIAARWEKFVLQCQAADGQIDAVSKNFPFTAFLSYLGMGEGTPYAFTNTANDMNIAKFVYSRIESIFEETEQCRPFELLRSFRDRGDLLLTRHAKIIAMTCTHAALKRADLVKLGFQYDNVIMEEAAQVMEIETFVPMLLQTMDKEGGHRLKRVVLIGDHHQLPPVVKNRAFQQYSHLDQSMFTRLVRLGTPTITLNLQGRARPAISSLYRWRYQQLGDLPSVTSLPQYRNANAGFAFEMQLIDVGDYNGRGETAPVPHFYQNLGEAEYVVQTFMLMRLLGYPAEKISIITSYNGQKFLIRDVIERRCGHNPLFGRPARITTVDKFQGQQNDYVLLSLVRTRAVGHMRDIRRLVVAMSRARLGLYVFGRAALFQNCYELSPAFMQLSKQPLKLHIVPGEAWPTTRDVSAKVDSMVIEDVVHMGRVVDQMARLTLQHLRNQSRDSRAADMKVRTELVFSSV
jgi:RecA/RadA recombinase